MIFALCILHSAHCRSIQMNNNETTIPFSSKFFPYVDSCESVNSSSIEIKWIPSSSAKQIDLTQLSGAVTLGFYAGDRLFTYSTLINYPLTKLNESGKITINNLKADSIYKILFQPVYKGKGTTPLIVGTPPSELVRTYMEGKYYSIDLYVFVKFD